MALQSSRQDRRLKRPRIVLLPTVRVKGMVWSRDSSGLKSSHTCYEVSMFVGVGWGMLVGG